MTKTKILIVEDHIQYREAAEKYFGRKPDIEPIYAADLVSAKCSYARTDIRGAIVDCFFRLGAGSGDILLGKEVVERMARSDPAQRRARDLLAEIEGIVDTTDETIKKYARLMVRYHHHDSIDDLVKVIKIFGIYHSKEFATNYFRQTFETHLGERDYGVWSEDLYQLLMDAMGESPDNQPLGVAFANQLVTLRKPFVLVTSTYHHDRFTQPVADYAGRMNWLLIDCEAGKVDDKATVEFWERAYKSLEKRFLFNSLHYVSDSS